MIPNAQHHLLPGMTRPLCGSSTRCCSMDSMNFMHDGQQARMNGPSSSRHFVTWHSVVNKAELVSCTSADTLMASSSCVRLRSKMFLKLSVKPSTNASRSRGTTLHLP